MPSTIGHHYKQMEPIISIITINFNNINGLKKTLRSVETQMGDIHYEHIIIDGGSTDGSAELINEYKEKNYQCSYAISEKDNGIYNAMNKGIDHAQGKYLLFLNSGDYLKENDILAQAIPYLESGEGLIYGNIKVTDENNLNYIKEYPAPPFSSSYLISSEFGLPHPGTFINAKLFSNRRYDENLKIVSDWKFWLQCIIFDNCTLKHIPLVVSVFNLNGISSTNIQLCVKERKQVLHELFGEKTIQDLELLNELRNAPLYDMFKTTASDTKFQQTVKNILMIPYKLRCKWKNKK